MRKKRFIFLMVFLNLAITGCVGFGAKVGGSDKGIRITSSHPIIAIDGEPLESVFEYWVSAGPHVITAVYPTLSYQYICVFTLEAQASARYEIVHQEKMEPLVLYRWWRRNILFAERLDPVIPECYKAETGDQ